MAQIVLFNKNGIVMETTLAQGNQVLNLILQKKMSLEKMQSLLGSGLLSDLLDTGEIETINRKEFRVLIGLEESKAKLKSHRFILSIHNLKPEDELVEEMMKQKFGQKKITVIKWRIKGVNNYLAYVSGASYKLPQTDYLVVVTYV